MTPTSQPSSTCSPVLGSWRSSDRAESARPPQRSPPVARSAGSDLADGGVWLARLETAVSADDVVDTVVAALNVGGEGALLERLKNGQAVLILDNCEHVLDSATELAARLLDAAPGLRILCTSQAPLGVDGEVVFELAPLAISDAVALFTDRAGSQRGEPRVRRLR